MNQNKNARSFSGSSLARRVAALEDALTSPQAAFDRAMAILRRRQPGPLAEADRAVIEAASVGNGEHARLIRRLIAANTTEATTCSA